MYLTRLMYDYVEQKVMYKTKVIETFRGEKYKHLSFDRYMEKDDTLSADIIGQLLIVGLCQSNNKFYWASVGSQFRANDKLITQGKARH